MIQELFNNYHVTDDKKLNTPPETQQNLRCPRCDSPNTKFCYYNNYNLTQPRHFCKTCRRYWTKGGALRNVPIGGGCRKTRPHSSSIAASTSFANGTHKSGYRFSQLAEALDRPESHFLALLKATQLQQQHQQQMWQQNLLNDVPTSSGIQEFYQRLKSSTGDICSSDYLPVMSASAAAAPMAAASTTMSVVEPIPLSVDMGYWNSNVSWSDVWTSNGAYN